MLIICSHLVDGKLINIFVEIWNFLEVFGGKINGNSIVTVVILFEIRDILYDQITHLKTEMLFKNTLIERENMFGEKNYIMKLNKPASFHPIHFAT